MEDLKHEELMAFAPKARSAQAEQQAPQSQPVTPFLLMKLPLELRTIVYRMHFSQPAEPDHPLYGQQPQPDMCRHDKLPFGRCPFRTFNGGVPVRHLWTLSKDLYHEAMPLYFQITEFSFTTFRSLGQFLNVIGPYHRQHVTRIMLWPCHFDSNVQCKGKFTETKRHTNLEALKLLRSCEALRHMKINLNAAWSHMAETSELFRAILKIRNLRSLDVYDYSAEDPPRASAEWWEFHEYNKQTFQVLKQPCRPADVEEREKEGIFSVAVPRTFFGLNDKLVVGEWFDVRESEAMRKESFENSASGCTELECLKRERKLVEASFGCFEDRFGKT